VEIALQKGKLAKKVNEKLVSKGFLVRTSHGSYEITHREEIRPPALIKAKGRRERGIKRKML